mmetsp:Transcript_8540/g.13470  ORF Transcript_8540/g.13470 Transcript_8540/m.13470 type:complete len:233 (-) Transcript_8540:434-1132(-)
MKLMLLSNVRALKEEDCGQDCGPPAFYMTCMLGSSILSSVSSRAMTSRAWIQSIAKGSRKPCGCDPLFTFPSDRGTSDPAESSEPMSTASCPAASLIILAVFRISLPALATPVVSEEQSSESDLSTEHCRFGALSAAGSDTDARRFAVDMSLSAASGSCADGAVDPAGGTGSLEESPVAVEERLGRASFFSHRCRVASTHDCRFQMFRTTFTDTPNCSATCFGPANSEIRFS